MTLEERLAWHDQQIAERLKNNSPTPDELELIEHLTEQRGHLLRMMENNPKEVWPEMAATIDASERFAEQQGKPN
jgi:hypothetical protein